jgi:hypothetical protein
MLLKDKQTGALVEIQDVQVLFDPLKSTIPGRIQDGQEEQDAEEFSKQNLLFLSDEKLPRCWLDPDYQAKTQPVR